MLDGHQPLPMFLRLGGVDEDPRADLRDEAGSFNLANHQRHSMAAKVGLSKPQRLAGVVPEKSLHLLIVVSPGAQDKGQPCKPEDQEASEVPVAFAFSCATPGRANNARGEQDRGVTHINDVLKSALYPRDILNVDGRA